MHATEEKKRFSKCECLLLDKSLFTLCKTRAFLAYMAFYDQETSLKQLKIYSVLKVSCVYFQDQVGNTDISELISIKGEI